MCSYNYKQISASSKVTSCQFFDRNRENRLRNVCLPREHVSLSTYTQTSQVASIKKIVIRIETLLDLRYAGAQSRCQLLGCLSREINLAPCGLYYKFIQDAFVNYSLCFMLPLQSLQPRYELLQAKHEALLLDIKIFSCSSR